VLTLFADAGTALAPSGYSTSGVVVRAIAAIAPDAVIGTGRQNPIASLNLLQRTADIGEA
jgi:hypothetical protein